MSIGCQYGCFALHVLLGNYLSLYLLIYPPAYPSTCLQVYLSICLPVYLSTCLPVYLSTCLPVYLSTWLPVYRIQVYLPTCLPVDLFTYPSVYLSTYLPISRYNVIAKMETFAEDTQYILEEAGLDTQLEVEWKHRTGPKPFRIVKIVMTLNSPVNTSQSNCTVLIDPKMWNRKTPFNQSFVYLTLL